MGAKNHAVIMPDGELLSFCSSLMSIAANACLLANKNLALNSIIGASFGGMHQVGLVTSHSTNEMLAAGQRCMALSVGQH